MPVKKPKVSVDDEFDAAPVTTRKLIQNLGVEDLNLPKSMVNRIAKGVFPPNTSVQKDAALAISKSATVFVNYLASHANDRATLNNKKTIQPEDVFEALRDLEFEFIVEQCQEEEKRFAAILNNKRNDYRRRVKEQKADGDKSITEEGEAQPGQSNGTTNGHTQHADGEPAAKKPRLNESAATDGGDTTMNGVEEGDETLDEDNDQEEPDEEEDDDEEAEEEESENEEQEGDLDGPDDARGGNAMEEDEASDSE